MGNIIKEKRLTFSENGSLPVCCWLVAFCWHRDGGKAPALILGHSSATPSPLFVSICCTRGLGVVARSPTFLRPSSHLSLCCVSLSVASLSSLPIHTSCRMTWTTKEEYAWLAERIPQWLRRKDEKGVKFITRTTSDFLRMFPSEIPRAKMQPVSASLLSTP